MEYHSFILTIYLKIHVEYMDRNTKVIRKRMHVICVPKFQYFLQQIKHYEMPKYCLA